MFNELDHSNSLRRRMLIVKPASTILAYDKLETNCIYIILYFYNLFKLWTRKAAKLTPKQYASATI